jgi:hypothetical protein
MKPLASALLAGLWQASGCRCSSALPGAEGRHDFINQNISDQGDGHKMRLISSITIARWRTSHVNA